MSIEEGKTYLLDTYAQVPVVFSSGEGMYLIDEDGNRYLDFVGGIAVNALGYKDPGFTEAIERVLGQGLLHCSNLYYNSEAIKAAKGLTALADMERVFFCNSGAEANEAALKLARKFGNLHHRRRTDHLDGRLLPRANLRCHHGDGTSQIPRQLRSAAAGVLLRVFNDLSSIGSW